MGNPQMLGARPERFRGQKGRGRQPCHVYVYFNHFPPRQSPQALFDLRKAGLVLFLARRKYFNLYARQ